MKRRLPARSETAHRFLLGSCPAPLTALGR